MRRLIVIGLAGLIAVAIAVAGAIAVIYARADVDTAGEVEFIRPLRIPPLAESRLDGRGRRVFDLTARVGRTEFRPGVPTETYGVNGSYLGPTLRARRGERVLVNVENALPAPTTMHWHGMHLPAEMDGGPHQVIPPGATWSPTWEISQPAATLWYHPHLHGRTAEHVYRGLAGLFLIDGGEGAERALPRRYGVDDVPVIVQDRRFEDDGGFDMGSHPFSPTGVLGDEILVNGTLAPFFEVRTERLRLRLLNASNARVYDLGFADDRSFSLVASDGGLLARPYETRRVMLSPGERAEIVVTMRPGERAVLRSTPPALGADAFTERFAGGDDRLDILELRAAGRLRPSPPVPPELAELPPADPGAAVRTRDFELDGVRINGRRMDMHRIDETVARGSTEIWRVTNDGGAPHSFHVHGVTFRVLDAPLSGWKDTVYVPPGRTLRLLVPFGGRADHQAPYMFHCHVLRHEDRGMMGQFVVE